MICKRIIALVLLVVTAFFVFVVPGYAATSEYTSTDTFWNWVARSNNVVQNLIGYGFTGFGLGAGAVCTKSEDTYHHATSYEAVLNDGHYRCICTECGEEFIGYESDLQQSYDAQVEALPAPSYNSDGSLYVSASGSLAVQVSSGFFGCPHFVGKLTDINFKVLFDCENNVVECSLKDGYTSLSYRGVRYGYTLIAPIDGMYTLISGPAYTSYYVLSNGTREPFTRDYSEGSAIFHSKGAEISDVVWALTQLSSGTVYTYSKFYSPVYKVVPHDSLIGEVNTIYNIQSRPTSITGDYGIIGDSGQITKVEGDYIVNETTNNYHNPATGTTTPIVDWSYDYGDRTYSLTLEGELSAEVQFGDDNVTINETTVNESGDTVTNNYTIYYLVDGSGSGTEDPDPSPSPSDPPACVHTWTEISRTEPTCTTAGKVMSTCSKCNQIKTETIPATGHTWVVERTVQTTYDEEGNLLQQGYTIYSKRH